MNTIAPEQLDIIRINTLCQPVITENYTITHNGDVWEWRTKSSNRLMGKSKYITTLMVMCNKSESLIAETGNTPR